MLYVYDENDLIEAVATHYALKLKKEGRVLKEETKVSVRFMAKADPTKESGWTFNAEVAEED